MYSTKTHVIEFNKDVAKGMTREQFVEQQSLIKDAGEWYDKHIGEPKPEAVEALAETADELAKKNKK